MTDRFSRSAGRSAPSGTARAQPGPNSQPRKQPRVLSVSELSKAARLLIEEKFPLVWVSGELSNFSRPRSGHWYFTLKDDRAQLRCAMFANRNRRLAFQPKDGDQVIIRGHLSLYEGRGDFQAIVEHIEPAGEGALRLAYEQLRAKLAQEGLFDEAHKADLLEYPEHICVISSATGAALQDVLAVLQRRYPIVAVTVLPTLVQGPHAGPAIIQALHTAAEIDADLVILTRGGGSLEDLWAFNLEEVVRAVVNCPVPLISAIGHETDVTLTDFAADLRAPTPSVAAEVATPDAGELLRSLQGAQHSLNHQMARGIEDRMTLVQQLQRRLVSPARRLEQWMQRADTHEQQLRRNVAKRLQLVQSQLDGLRARLLAQSPSRRFDTQRVRLRDLQLRLARASQAVQNERQNRFGAAWRALNAMNPLGTLERGYAIVTQGPTNHAQPWGAPLNSASDANVGGELLAHLNDGIIACTINEVRPPRLTAAHRSPAPQTETAKRKKS